MSISDTETALISTGIPGLDAVLGGGLTPRRLYLTQGDPGAGKTTLALQFLLAGKALGERTLYVTLSETRPELAAVAKSHGWSLEGVDLFEITAGEDTLQADEQYSVFHPSEIELGQTVRTLLEEVNRVKPRRAVIDSLSEMRLLARDPLRYRRQILALKQFFIERDCTVMLLDDPATKVGEHQFQSLAHGVFQLEQFVPEYGAKRRRLQVVKLRGQSIDGGYHDYILTTGGITLFPRVVAGDHRSPFMNELVSSGLKELDTLLGGGIPRGTSALFLGAAGTGKSTLGTQYVAAAVERNERAAIFLFDERYGTFVARARELGLDIGAAVDSGQVNIHQIDPAELAPGQFAHAVAEVAQRDNARVVVIDSLNGYLNAMPDARFLLSQMHELLTYLGQKGVLTLLVVSQHGALGTGVESPVDISYLADSVIWLRYFEHAGEVRKAISVIKNRVGPHESTIREMQITSRGIWVGPPLSKFHGVLTGTPEYLGTEGACWEVAMSHVPDKHRVLAIAPFGRDAQLIREELARVEIEAEQIAGVPELCRCFGPSISALIIAEEALSSQNLDCLAELLRKQPPWSDIPVLLLTGGGKTTRGSAYIVKSLSACANITLLERPIRVLTIISAVQAALRARGKQYEVRDLLAASQRSVRQRDEFLAMLGHELRNPIGTIRNAIEVLETVSGKADADWVEAEHRGIIRRQSRHMGHLIDDLLDVSRVTTGKITLSKIPVDVRELVQRCLQAAEPAINAERHEVSMELDAKPLIVDGDPVRIEQVVTNLITNAVKYTPTGGMIQVTAKRCDGNAVIKVRDNGLGIAPELLPHIFDLFTQGHHTIDRAHGGLGIGLTVVHSLVQMHGGKIGAESEGARKGTVFTVELPLTSAPVARSEMPARTSVSKKRILIVEDNADARKALRVLLQICGHSVEVAEDGVEGVKAALRMKPDVALVDIGLPKLDGHRVAREVRAALGKSVCLVALTGYGQPEDQQRALDAGFDLHLTKPVDPPRLFETIDRADCPEREAQPA